MRPSPISFQVYKPFAQEAWQYVTIAIRATDPAKIPALLDPIRQAVTAIDPDQPVPDDPGELLPDAPEPLPPPPIEPTPDDPGGDPGGVPEPA